MDIELNKEAGDQSYGLARFFFCLRAFRRSPYSAAIHEFRLQTGSGLLRLLSK